MWRATTKLRCICRLQAGTSHGCGYCSKSSATAAAAAKGTAPPMTKPPDTVTPSPTSSGGAGGGGDAAGAFFKLLGLTMVGAGSLVGYAWYDPKFRNSLEDNVPGAKTILDVALNYLPASSTQVPQTPIASHKIEQGDPDAKMNSIKQGAIAMKKEAEKKAEMAKTPIPRKEDMVRRMIQEKDAEDAAENAALESILADVLGETVEAARAGIDILNNAAVATRQHVTHLKSAMDGEAVGDAKNEQWKLVTKAFDAKLQAEGKVESKLMDAKESLEKLHQAIKDGRESRVTRKNKALLGVEESYAQLAYDIKNAEGNLERARSENRVIDEYRDLIKKGREEFRKELESVKPDIRIGRRVGGRMTEDELNLLIAHAHRRVEQLQRQLAEQSVMEGQRVEKAVRRQQLEDLRLADSRVGREITHLKAQFELEKRRIEMQNEAETEQAIHVQLTRQALAHSDHIAQVLAIQQEAMEKKYQQLLHDQVLTEREAIREEVAGWIARLEGIEAAIDARAEMEKLGRKAQQLWLACQTLVSVIETGREDATSWEGAKKPLDSEIEAIRDAGNEHPFVNTVVQALSEEVRDGGVMTKDALIDRFDKVQRVCRRVALIDETGASLYRYFLSYVQSMFVFNSRPFRESDPIDPKQLSTFILVNNAKYSLEHGDLEQAVKYMNQLSGESRRVASDWLREARLLLETKQAADALFAHASCAGLGSLF